jgi:hypothetical protein
VLILVEGNSFAGEVLAAGLLESAELGRGGVHDGEGGGAGEVNAERFTHEFGAVAMLDFADPFELARHR